MVIKMRNISKQAWTEAKAAGLTTLTFAAWRAEQKAVASETGEQITTFDTSGAATDTEVADINAGIVLNEQLNEAANTPAGAVIDEGDVDVETLDQSQLTGAVINEGDVTNTNSAAAVIDTIDAALTNVFSERVRLAVENKESKSKIAQAIFADALDKQTATGVPMVRKDIITLFIAVAGLSKPGANTYYQNIREKNGLVTKKA